MQNIRKLSLCLLPPSLVRWWMKPRASSVADMADRQAGRPAANPTCQPGQSQCQSEITLTRLSNKALTRSSQIAAHTSRTCWSKLLFADSAASQQKQTSSKRSRMNFYLPPSTTVCILYTVMGGWLFHVFQNKSATLWASLLMYYQFWF